MTWIRDKYKTLEKFLLLRRVREKWENSSYRVAMKDPEGDLLLEGYRRRRDGMFRGYFLTGVMSLYFVSRVIVRIVKGYEFVVLPAGISVMSAIVIISVHVMFMSEFIMMYRVYRKKKGDRLGVYREQRRGMMGGMGPNRWRLLMKLGKGVGSGLIGTGAGIAAANEVGRVLGYQDWATKKLEGGAKKVGLHKENWDARAARLEAERKP